MRAPGVSDHLSPVKLLLMFTVYLVCCFRSVPMQSYQPNAMEDCQVVSNTPISLLAINVERQNHVLNGTTYTAKKTYRMRYCVNYKLTCIFLQEQQDTHSISWERVECHCRSCHHWIKSSSYPSNPPPPRSTPCLSTSSDAAACPFHLLESAEVLYFIALMIFIACRVI